MNTRLLLAPMAAFAILTFAAPVSAQESDPQVEWKALTHDDRGFKRDLTRFERYRDRCEPVDDVEATRLAEVAQVISDRAADLAPRLATTHHAAALRMHALVTADYWWLKYHGFEAAVQCYVPPAE